MSRLNHERNNRRVVRSELQRHARMEESKEGWDRFNKATQSVYLAFARAHADKDSFLRSVADRGRVSREQAATIRQIQSDNPGWEWPSVGSAGEPSTPDFGTSEQRRARELLEGYEGSDGTVRYWKRDWIGNGKMPTRKQSLQILRCFGEID